MVASVSVVYGCLCIGGRLARPFEVTEPQRQALARTRRARRSARARSYCAASPVCVLSVCRATCVSHVRVERANMWRRLAVAHVWIGVG